MKTMEEAIQKLKELADEYAELVNRMPIRHHTKIQYGDNFYERIELYFTDDKKYSIAFEKIEVVEYLGIISIPLNYTANDIERVYNEAKRILKERKEKIKKKAINEKRKKIEDLKKVLTKLEEEENNN